MLFKMSSSRYENSHTVYQLQRLLRDRGLKISGLKRELIERLVDDDLKKQVDESGKSIAESSNDAGSDTTVTIITRKPGARSKVAPKGISKATPKATPKSIPQPTPKEIPITPEIMELSKKGFLMISEFRKLFKALNSGMAIRRIYLSGISTTSYSNIFTPADTELIISALKNTKSLRYLQIAIDYQNEEVFKALSQNTSIKTLIMHIESLPYVDFIPKNATDLVILGNVYTSEFVDRLKAAIENIKHHQSINTLTVRDILGDSDNGNVTNLVLNVFPNDHILTLNLLFTRKLDIDEDSLQRLMASNVTNLSIQYMANGGDMNVVHNIVNGLATNNRIKTFELSTKSVYGTSLINNISDAIANLIRNNVTLNKLNLSGHKFNDETGYKFIDAFTNMRGHALVSLNLSGNAFSEKVFVELAPKIPLQLKYLTLNTVGIAGDLKTDNIGEFGEFNARYPKDESYNMYTVEQAFEHIFSSDYSDHYRQSNSMMEFSLNNNQFRSGVIFDAIATNQTLIDLSLVYNNYDDEAAEKIVHMIKHNTTLTSNGSGVNHF